MRRTASEVARNTLRKIVRSHRGSTLDKKNEATTLKIIRSDSEVSTERRTSKSEEIPTQVSTATNTGAIRQASSATNTGAIRQASSATNTGTAVGFISLRSATAGAMKEVGSIDRAFPLGAIWQSFNLKRSSNSRGKKLVPIAIREADLKNTTQARTLWISAFSAIMGFLVAMVLVGSRSLAFPFMAIGATFPYLRMRRRREKELARLTTVWPELLDHMISGLRSGLSLAETISALARRGPEISRSIFKECEMILLEGNDLSVIFQLIKIRFNDPIADQVCEVLDFSRGTGSRDTALTLRTLGDFIRSDIAVRGEIKAKLGWVKNSAGVAAIAPWILLVILSAQPSTIAAFSTGTGIGILILGLGMCGVAYFWMSKVGRIEEVPRIFMPQEIS